MGWCFDFFTVALHLTRFKGQRRRLFGSGFQINYFTRKDYEIFVPFMSQNDILKSSTANLTPSRKLHAQREACLWRIHLSRGIKVLRS